MDIEIIEVPAEVTETFYKYVKPLVVKTLKFVRGEYDETYIQASLKSGQLTLLIASDGNHVLGMAIVGYEEYPRIPILRILQIAGTSKLRWEDKMHQYIEGIAKRLHCVRIEGAGRRGWQSTAKKFGYSAYFVTYIKEI